MTDSENGASAEAALIAELQSASLHAERGDWDSALTLSRRVLVHDPANPIANYLAGIACVRLSRPSDAIAYLTASIVDDEQDVNKLAIVTALLRESGDLEAAIPFLERSAAIAPTPETLNQLGIIYADKGRLGDAIRHFRASLALQPQDNIASVGLYPLLRIACEWTAELETLSQDIDRLNTNALSKGELAPEPPFDNLHRVDDPAANLRIAQSCSTALSKEAAAFSVFPVRPISESGRPIRIGYLSADLQNHAIGYLMRGVFRAHDHQDFSITAYSYGPDDGGDTRKIIQNACDSFVDISRLSDSDAAAMIHRDEIDVLVDLTGHTRRNRLAICARRPAPIQVTYLGFPGTSGADFFDYAITDNIVTPPGFDAHFSENLVRLPHAYQSNDNTQSEVIEQNTYSEFNNFQFIFSSFNNPIKIDSIFFNIWLELLNNIPNSALWVLQNNPLAQENLRKHASKNGVDPGRILFAEMASRAEHLNRMACSDLALDTRIYNGHTTTSDALWAGVPVVTMEGRHFASRVSASLLRAMDLPELIASDIDDYAALAHRLATTPDELRRLREKIATHRRTAPLFDTERFTRDLEAVFAEMVRRHRSGQRPSPLILSDLRN